MNHSKILVDLITRIKSILIDEVDISATNFNSKSNKWSKKQILGHLIDSASNNHQRFIRACFKEDLIFDGYDQESWVKLQNYNEREWLELVDIWYHANLQLSRLIQQIGIHELKRPREIHNLDRIAFKTVDPQKSVSLEYFINDYIAHLEHHIIQILPSYQPVILDKLY